MPRTRTIQKYRGIIDDGVVTITTHGSYALPTLKLLHFLRGYTAFDRQHIFLKIRGYAPVTLEKRYIPR